MTEHMSGDGFLGVLLPEQAAQDVLRWRRVVPGILADLGAPHITLVYPPFVRRELWPQVAIALSECIGAFSPFDVVLRETGTFPGNPAYLWLKPEDGGVVHLDSLPLGEG